MDPLMRHVPRVPTQELLVLGALSAHPTPKSWIPGVLGGHIAISKLAMVFAEFMELLEPRRLTLTLGPRESDAFKLPLLGLVHATSLTIFHELLFHTLLVDPL
mgnify:CR=1 FL=1